MSTVTDLRLVNISEQSWRIAPRKPFGRKKVPQASTKPVDVTYLPLATPNDMLAALIAALSIPAPAGPYYGQLVATATGEWAIQLSGPNQPRVDGFIGETLIWNGSALNKINTSDFASQYTPKP